MASDFIEIHWTSGSIDEARKISRYLVQEHFVACAQIVPWIESIYTWNDKLETTQESKIILKTRASLFDEVKKIIKENSSYQVPEITKFAIEDGNKDYFDWILESTKK